MNPGNIQVIQEINSLWKPVYPHLARQVGDLYGRRDGKVLEAGPFCGVLFAMSEMTIGDSFRMAVFPGEMTPFFREETDKQASGDRAEIIETDPFLKEIPEHDVDLFIFRGAFFFPSLFQVHFREMDRVLKHGGMAFIGGGFGKHTPEAVLQEIGKKSRELNLALGKVEMTEDQLRKEFVRSNMEGAFEVITEGGLWVVIRK